MVKHIIYKRKHIIYKAFNDDWVFLSISDEISLIKNKTIRHYINLIKHDTRYTNIHTTI